MDAIVVPQEPPPRTTTWGWRWVGVTLTTLSLPPRCPPFVARFSCANSDVAILADSADAGFPRTSHVCFPPRGTLRERNRTASNSNWGEEVIRLTRHGK